MIGALGANGKPDAADPVDRESSRVQAVVAVMPPTDLLNWGAPGALATDAKNMASFIPVFGFSPNEPREQERAVAKTFSPIYFVSPSFPPTLLIHGDKDQLVPLQQSQSMSAALQQANVEHNLIISPGTGHDGGTYAYAMAQEVQWFVKYLLKP
jgi:acetyl esterase/lipase